MIVLVMPEADGGTGEGRETLNKLDDSLNGDVIVTTGDKTKRADREPSHAFPYQA